MKKTNMNIGFWVSRVILTATLFAACAQDDCHRDPSAKVMDDYEKIAEETRYFIEQYEDVDPDYVVRYEMDGLSYQVRGHLESPILFYNVTGAGDTDDYKMSYQDDTRMKLVRRSDHQIEVMYGGFAYKGVHLIMDELWQEGELLSFRMSVNDSTVGNFQVESAHFKGVDVVGSIGSDAKIAWGPIVVAALKYVVLPLATSVAGSVLVNSCSDDDKKAENAAVECNKTMQTGIEACLKLGKIPYARHMGDNHQRCIVTCLPAE